MANKPSSPIDTQATHRRPLERARDLMRKLDWLSPLSTLNSAPSSKFGRRIEASLAEVTEGEVIRLQLRKRDAAVVMSAGHYEELVEMKSLCAALIEQVRAGEVADAAGEYDTLYRRITSAPSREAADALFDASAEELAGSWQPGKTEKP